MTVISDRDEFITMLLDTVTNNEIKETFLFCPGVGIRTLYTDKAIVRDCVEIINIGGFHSGELAYHTLRYCIVNRAQEIADWYISRTNKPLEMIVDTDIPVGYNFDRQLNEYDESKVCLRFRRDREEKTRYGFFVSSFAPIGRDNF